MRIGEHAARVRSVAALLASNRELGRTQLAFAAFNGAEWAVWIAMLVYAYDQGGATTAGLVALAQLVPAALFAPFAASLADRHRPARILTFGYVLQSGGMAATAAVLLVDGPPFLAYGCAAFAATAVTITRPTQSALTPALARRADELCASNVIAGWIESASVLVAPAAAGVLLALGGPGWVFAAMAGLTAGAALVVAPIVGPPPAAPDAPASALRGVAEGVEVLRRERSARILVSMLAAQFVAIGLLDVLYVVLAIDTLGLGESGAGYLNAAFGAGGVVGIWLTVSLVGRARLVPPILAALGLWAAAFALLALWPEAVAAFLLLAAAGAARSLFDVAGRTLLQRSAPTEVLARVFGVLEGLSMAGLAAGSLLAPLLIGLGGTTVALVGAAAVLPLVALLGGRGLFRLDAEASVPVVELSLLRSMRIFAVLSPPALEGLAAGLEERDLAAGETVVRQGEAGDRYYAIADGELDVLEEDVLVRTLGRGEGFGEIALLRDVPRTATVRARTDARVYELEKDVFLAAVTGCPATTMAADEIVAERSVPARAS